MNHMILNDHGQIDYAGSYERTDTDKCICCGDVCLEEELNSEGLCEACAWDYVAPEDQES